MSDANNPIKADLLAKMEAGWNDFDAYLKGLSLEQLTTPKDAVGWTVKDHLVHLALWEGGVAALLRKQSRRDYMQIDQATWDATWKDGNFDPINATIAKRYKDASLSEVLRMMQDAHHDMVTAIEALSDAELQRPYREYAPGSTREDAVMNSIGGNSFAHYAEHKPWIAAIVAQGE